MTSAERPGEMESLQRLLEAVAKEAQPLLAEHKTGRIVVNFSGGSRVRIEVATSTT